MPGLQISRFPLPDPSSVQMSWVLGVISWMKGCRVSVCMPLVGSVPGVPERDPELRALGTPQSSLGCL